jgi:hypothetical protein
MFKVLVRAFFGQFFASESVTSEMQLHKAMVGPLALLITPAVLAPFQLISAFEMAAIRFPQLLEGMTRVIATIFITYSMVSIGVIAAVMWDSLSFDRRDAMVLGPLPLRSGTVVSAKVAALGLLLLVAAVSMNLPMAALFSMTAGNHKSAVGVLRHFVAHMATTLCAATFVFCLLVTLRALIGSVAGRRVVVASILRFVLFSAMLCFIIFVPVAFNISPGGRRRPAELHMMGIPPWSPTNWFLGLYEWIRGSDTAAESAASARQAVMFTAAMVGAAITMTIAGYRRQLQLALTPSASTGRLGSARIPRAIAWLFVFRDRIATSISRFILTTLARSSPQQVTIAINAAIGLTIVVGALLRAKGDITQLMRPRTAVLWIPLMLTYWVAVGLRASFFVPAELPAAWSFRFNAPVRSTAYWSAVRASAIGFLLPLALLFDAPLTFLIGARAAAWHALVVAAVVLVLGETIALTVDFVPFTRPYEPGHAKLRTRWPLYLIGLFLFALWPARAAMWRAGDPDGIVRLAAVFLAIAVVLEIAGRVHARRWAIDPAEEFVEPSEINVLDIGMVVPHTPAP